MRYIILTLLIFLTTLKINSQTENLRDDINKIISESGTRTGVSLYSFTTGDTLSIRGDEFFPMQSVFKFHIALAILNMADRKELKLSDEIFIDKSDLHENTWSPMRDKNPDGNFNISIAKLLEYSVSLSDNNACDILIRIAGGTEKIQEYFDGIKLENFYIVASEYEMHKEWEIQFRNKTTPKASTEIIKKIYTDNLFSKESFDFLYKIMTESQTGQKRIKEKLPVGTIIAHKTGTSGKSAEGLIVAVNDIAFISLTNGQKYILSVYVSDSKLDYPENEKIISDISKAVFEYYK
ncbi:MAG TPA: class A beta-lactamase, subclass A2 [Ignavibacteria bacterium]|nr:class A beta-lactamase, subclass A2 [Ignavibacteria bacterium]